MTSTARCPLCQQNHHRMTSEDVLPQWLRRRLLNDLPETDPNRFPRMRYSICAGCNGTLNVRFEISARELVLAMMDGQRIQLTPIDCRVVASWMLKTDLLIATFRRARGESFFHPTTSAVDLSESLANFRAPLLGLMGTGTLPKDSTVSAGFLNMSLASRTRPFWTREDGDVGLYSMVRWVPLVYETVMNDRHARRHARRRARDNRLVVLHPSPEGSVDWPPKPMTLPESKTLMMSRELATWSNPIRPQTAPER